MFTHFWTHMMLIIQSLSAVGADYAVFKRDLKPTDKEEALLKFQVPSSSSPLPSLSDALSVSKTFRRCPSISPRGALLEVLLFLTSSSASSPTLS